MINLKKKIVILLSSLIFIFSLGINTFANVNPIVDDANLLNEDEENALRNTIEEIRNTYNIDAVIVTSNDLEGKSQREYADDYYDYNGYGIDSENSGLLLLIDMEERYVYISTTGIAIDYFTDSRIDTIVSDITEYLKSDDYYYGCHIFLNDIKYYMDKGVPKSQYRVDEDSMNEEDRSMKILAIGVTSGAVVAIIVTLLVVNSYKNPKKISAVNYVDRESIRFTDRKDIFISTHTTKTKIEKNSVNRSSSHSSSSGRSHGGGGGRF